MENKEVLASRFRMQIGKYIRSAKDGEAIYIVTYYSEPQVAVMSHKELIRLQNIEKEYINLKRSSNGQRT